MFVIKTNIGYVRSIARRSVRDGGSYRAELTDERRLALKFLNEDDAVSSLNLLLACGAVPVVGSHIDLYLVTEQ